MTANLPRPARFELANWRVVSERSVALVGINGWADVTPMSRFRYLLTPDGHQHDG